MLNNLGSITITEYILLGTITFSIGLFSAITNRKSLIDLLISVELMIIGTQINFVAFSSFTNNILGQIFSIFIITVTASELAIGLAIIITYYKNKGNINLNNINNMRQ